MSWNGSGVYSLPALYFPEAPGNLVDSTRYNGTLNDLATGLNNVITKDGQTSATANLPMGGFKHTGVANASTTGEYFAFGQGFNDGNTATPSIFFISDTDTGIYRDAANSISIGAGGVEVLTVRSTGFLMGPSGSAAAPSMTFGASPTTGFYRSGANILGFATNGTERMFIDALGNTISNPQTAVPALAVNGQMVFNLTSNTNLRISARGSDGVTRVANITLA